MPELLDVIIHGPARIVVGSSQGYTVLVRNSTSTTAYNTSLEIRVSPGFIIQESNNTFYRVDIGTLEPGQEYTVDITVQANSYVLGYISAVATAFQDSNLTHRGDARVYIQGVPSIETDWRVYVPDTGVAILKWLYLTPTQVENVWNMVKDKYYGRMVVGIFELEVEVEGGYEKATVIMSRRSVRVIGTAGMDPDVLEKVFEAIGLPIPSGSVITPEMEWATGVEPWIYARPYTGIAMVFTGVYTYQAVEQVYQKVKDQGGQMIGFTAYCWTFNPGTETDIRPEFVLSVYPRDIRVTGRKARDVDFLNQLQQDIISVI